MKQPPLPPKHAVPLPLPQPPQIIYITPPRRGNGDKLAGLVLLALKIVGGLWLAYMALYVFFLLFIDKPMGHMH